MLLICPLLNTETLSSYISACDRFGLSAPIEAHTKKEVLSAREVGARIIRINNRDPKTSEVDFNNFVQPCSLVLPEILFVTESDIRMVANIHIFYEVDVSAVLIGETSIRSVNKELELGRLRSGCYSV